MQNLCMSRTYLEGSLIGTEALKEPLVRSDESRVKTDEEHERYHLRTRCPIHDHLLLYRLYYTVG
jgi:hypothetical protein